MKRDFYKISPGLLEWLEYEKETIVRAISWLILAFLALMLHFCSGWMAATVARSIPDIWTAAPQPHHFLLMLLEQLLMTINMITAWQFIAVWLVASLIFSGGKHER